MTDSSGGSARYASSNRHQRSIHNAITPSDDSINRRSSGNRATASARHFAITYPQLAHATDAKSYTGTRLPRGNATRDAITSATFRAEVIAAHFPGPTSQPLHPPA